MIWISPAAFKYELFNLAWNFLLSEAISPCKMEGISFGFETGWLWVKTFSRLGMAHGSGRSLSMTGLNVRLRVWLMFGLRIWAETTSRSAWHMCWSFRSGTGLGDSFWWICCRTRSHFLWDRTKILKGLKFEKCWCLIDHPKSEKWSILKKWWCLIDLPKKRWCLNDLTKIKMADFQKVLVSYWPPKNKKNGQFPKTVGVLLTSKK